MTVLVVMAVLFASCSNGMSKDDSDGSASTKVVKVSLSLGGEAANIAQKAIALDDQNSGYTYFYKATPNWTDDARGKTNGFVPIGYANSNHSYEDDFALGYFTPGNWTFEVEIRASDETTVLYEGSDNNVSISIASVEIVIPMTLKTDQQGGVTGTVNIKVAVPKISPNTTVAMELDGNSLENLVSTPNSHIDTSGNVTQKDGWIRFDKLNISSPTGNHTFVLTYKDGANVVGGAAIAFTVKNGETYNIYGTIENGKYQIVTLTLTMPELNLTMNTTPNASSVGMDGSYTAEITDHDCDTYVWRVNNVIDNNYTSYNFTLDTSAPGVYEIACIATKVISGETAIATVPKTVTVTPPNNYINIISKIDGDGKNIKAAATGDTIVCTPVNLPNGTTKWYVNGTEQEAGVDGNNVFTFDNVTSTTKTGTAGSYKIACKVIDNGSTIGYGEKTITISNP